MLDNLIFSISSALPIFSVMVIGYMLKKKDIIDDEFIKRANRLVFYIALPIKLLKDVSETSFNEYFDIKFLIFIIIGMIFSAIISWLFGLFIIKEKNQLGAFIHGSFRGNFIYIGLSLMENITGSIGYKAPLMIAVVIPLYNILAVIILTYTNRHFNSKINVKDIFKEIIKNPLIVAIMLGIIISQIGFNIPLVITRTMGYFEALATPLALIAIGASFKLQKLAKNMRISLIASILKLILIPLAAVIIAMRISY